MPFIKSQFDPWGRLGIQTCHKCGRPINPGDWNWMGSTAKLPVGDPRKYSHADCSQGPSYKHFESKFAKPVFEEKKEEKEVQESTTENTTENIQLEPSQKPPEPLKISPTPAVYSPAVIVAQANLITPARIPATLPGEHSQYQRLKKLIENCMDCYLGGDPGAGKSYNIKKASEDLNRRYSYMALSDATMPSAIFGYKNHAGQFVKTLFYDFYMNGGVLDIAELDNTNANVFTMLNNAHDNGYAQFEGLTLEDAFQRVKRDKSYCAVGNGNTFLRGPDGMFPERKQQDAAAIERFVMIPWRYDEQLELELVASLPSKAGRSTDPSEQSPFNPERVVRWAQRLRENCKAGKNGQVQAEPLVVSMRAMLKLVSLLKMGFPRLEAIHMAIFKEYDKDRTETLLKQTPIDF